VHTVQFKKHEAIVPIVLSVMSGWNIALVVFFLVSIAIGSMLSGSTFSQNQLYMFIGTSIISALGIGTLSGRYLLPKFAEMENRTKFVWLACLSLITVAAFPGPFFFSMSTRVEGT